MTGTFHNAVQAFRATRRSPGFLAAAALLLGCGTGGSSAVFSVMRQVLLAPIPGVSRSEELVRFRRAQGSKTQNNQSYPDYVDIRDGSRALDGVIAERTGSMLVGIEAPRMEASAIVTGNYFQVLGVRAAAGRLLSPNDDRTPGAHPVAVISEAYAKRQSGPSVGRSIVLNHRTFTIVGVAAAPFGGVEYGQPVSIWIPMAMMRTFLTRQDNDALFSMRSAGWLTVYGRLARGVGLESAQAEAHTLASALAAQYRDTNRGRDFLLHDHAGMTPQARENLRTLLLLLFAAMGMVLVVACGNVAILMLARAATRAREDAIRLALGTGRWGLVAQAFWESLIVGVAGGVMGAIFAPWMRTGLRQIWKGPELVPASGPDGIGLLFIAAISAAAIVLFGTAPAWARTRTHPAAALRSGSAGAAHGSGIQRVWVVSQVALSVALVAGGSLVWRSMQRILAIDPGFAAARVVSVGMDLSILEYTAEPGSRLFSRMLERAAAIPGVRSATLAKSSPAVDWSDRVEVGRTGDDGAPIPVPQNRIAPGYFRTLGIALLAGRDFSNTDTPLSGGVAIVSEALAGRLWPGANALGQWIVLPVQGEPMPAPLQVVGVAADARYGSVLEPPPPLLYIPLWQNYDSIARVMVAVDGPPAGFKVALLQAMRSVEPRLPFTAAATLEEELAAPMWRRRYAAWVLGFFGMLAVLLACAGIYGVTAYTTARRRREIGIRIALGGRPAQVLRAIMWQAVRLAGWGILVGLLLAYSARPLERAFLFESNGLEPIAYVGVPLLFAGLAVVASLMPARRAAATDPISALRQD